jgi:hypothetical protein
VAINRPQCLRKNHQTLPRLVVVRLSGVPQNRGFSQQLEKPRCLFDDLAQVNVFRSTARPLVPLANRTTPQTAFAVLSKFLRIESASRNSSCLLISLGRYRSEYGSRHPHSSRRVRKFSNSSSVRIPFTRNRLSRSIWRPGSISAVASTGGLSCRGAVVTLPPLGSSTPP